LSLLKIKKPVIEIEARSEEREAYYNERIDDMLEMTSAHFLDVLADEEDSKIRSKAIGVGFKENAINVNKAWGNI